MWFHNSLSLVASSNQVLFQKNHSAYIGFF
uniref:Uncharacterized protein n=1 Tax=Utricularia reniformis TaxID=192314 RepID=A0A1Y0B2Q2_9LAMI|nr:hypothetical protein AEK19_MT1533 [Utricularia reniformis]ART31722.1 hypothetical protein AEK19_MT1533 [Utricularia reniformis]